MAAAITTATAARRAHPAHSALVGLLLAARR
jgi:hypothetical protein